MRIKSSKNEYLTVPDGMEAEALDAQANGTLHEFAAKIKERMKSGGMIKRKDGHYSRRGLWDNIRANRGSGKKPTKEMLRQEAKIRAQHADGGQVTTWSPGAPVSWHSSTIHGEGGYTEGPNIGELGPTKPFNTVHGAPYSNAGAAYIFGDPVKYAMPLPTNIEQKAIEAQGLYNIPGRGVKDLIDRRYINPLKTGDGLDDLWYDAKLSREETSEGAKYKVDTYGDRNPARFKEEKRVKEGKGGYVVKRSSARKGKTHVVIGPDGTKKYFGDSHLGQHPNDPARKKSFYARHKHNLAKNPYFRAFARATWAEGGKLGQGIYDQGLMPYADGGYTMGNMNPDGMIHVPYGYGTPSYNERYDFGGVLQNWGAEILHQPANMLGLGHLTDNLYDKSDSSYKTFANINKVVDPIGKVAAQVGATALGGPMAGMAMGQIQNIGQTAVPGKRDYNKDPYNTWDKVGEFSGQAAQLGSMFMNPAQGAAGAAGKAGDVSKLFNTGGNMGSPLGNMMGNMAKHGGYVRMQRGGEPKRPSKWDIHRFDDVDLPKLYAEDPEKYAAYLDSVTTANDWRGYTPEDSMRLYLTSQKINDFLRQSPESVWNQGLAKTEEDKKMANFKHNVFLNYLSSPIGAVSRKSVNAPGGSYTFLEYQKPVTASVPSDYYDYYNTPADTSSVRKPIPVKESIPAAKPSKTQTEKGTVEYIWMPDGSKISKEEFDKRYGKEVKQREMAPKYADGGETGMVPINVEGANFSQGSGPDAKKGELLVKDGKIIKNYVARPPHPVEGQNPMGNDEAPEGLIVIPKARTAEYLEAGLEKRKQIEKSLVSQQQYREMKKSNKMGDGGYYSFGMGDMGMGRGGVAYSDQLGGHDFAAKGGPIGNPETINSMMGYGYKKGGWIQKATASIKRRGTEGVCTGAKFGSSSCPPGSRRYNLAKTFRKMAKHADGGMVNHDMYRRGGATSGAEISGSASYNPYDKSYIDDTRPYQDIENSRVSDTRLRVEGKVPIGKFRDYYGPSANIYLRGFGGIDQGMKRDVSEFSTHPLGYRMTGWSPNQEITAGAGIGMNAAKNNPRNPRGFQMTSLSGEVGGSYSNAHLSPYIKGDIEGEYNFGKQRRVNDQPFSAYGGAGFNNRFRGNDSYGGQMQRDPSANELMTGNTFFGGRLGVRGNFDGISPYVEYGRNFGTKEPVYKVGVTKTFEMGGATNVTHDFPIRRLKYQNTGMINAALGTPYTPSLTNTEGYWDPEDYAKWTGQSGMNSNTGTQQIYNQPSDQNNWYASHDLANQNTNFANQSPIITNNEVTNSAGSYGPVRGINDYGSFNYYDPNANNYDPQGGMQGWYGYDSAGNPTGITDPSQLNILNNTYRGGNVENLNFSGGNQSGNAGGQGINGGANPRFRNTWDPMQNLGGVNADYSAPKMNPRNPYSIGALKNIPQGTASERYMENVDRDMRATYPDIYRKSRFGTPSPNSPEAKDKTKWDCTTGTCKPIKTYRDLGYGLGAAEMLEGLLSKPEKYKRMALNRQAPELLNPREALADERRTAAGLKYGLRNTGANQRSALVAGAAQSAGNRAGIYSTYDNANAQIRNAYKDKLVQDQMALMQQDQVAQMYDAQARANRRNMIRQGANQIVGTAGDVANMYAQNYYLKNLAKAGV